MKLRNSLDGRGMQESVLTCDVELKSRRFGITKNYFCLSANDMLERGGSSLRGDERAGDGEDAGMEPGGLELLPGSVPF